MLRFHIDIVQDKYGIYGFEWFCYSNNNRLLFESFRQTQKLRNCVNHIKTLTDKMKDGSYCFVITKRADKFRKELGEPLYGIKK